MKQATRFWLKDLIVTRNNGKAIEIRDYIQNLEDRTVEIEAQVAALKDAAKAVVDARDAVIKADLMSDREYTDTEREEIAVAEGNAIDNLAALIQESEDGR